MRVLSVLLCTALATTSLATAEVSAAVAQVADASAPEMPPARDPTIPSAKILERLQSENVAPSNLAAPPVEAVVELAELPELRMKGIVMLDRDRGVAMLECGGRKLTIRLSRDSLVPAAGPISTSARLSGFAIHSETFYLVDFSDRSLLLRTGERTVLVQ